VYWVSWLQLWSTDHSVLPAVNQTKKNIFLHRMHVLSSGTNIESHRATQTHECEITYIVWKCMPLETLHGIIIILR